MSIKGPILLVEDDENDIDVILAAIDKEHFPNDIHVFTNATLALEYLTTTIEKPFLMLCDIKMHTLNGLEFRNALDKNEFLKKKSIPFIFYTGAVSQPIVDEAYDMTIQGFFVKASNFEEMKKQISAILTYWKGCIHPNSF